MVTTLGAAHEGSVLPRNVIVDDLRIYPVKALRGHGLQASSVAIWGLEHDRRWMVVKPDGRFLTQRELPAMARISALMTGDALIGRGRV
jgi:uncharacterized protein YcbX